MTMMQYQLQMYCFTNRTREAHHRNIGTLRIEEIIDKVKIGGTTVLNLGVKIIILMDETPYGEITALTIITIIETTAQTTTVITETMTVVKKGHITIMITGTDQDEVEFIML